MQPGFEVVGHAAAIAAQRLLKELFLTMECTIKTTLADMHRVEEIFDRTGSIAMAPEVIHGVSNCLVAIKLSRPTGGIHASNNMYRLVQNQGEFFWGILLEKWLPASHSSREIEFQ